VGEYKSLFQSVKVYVGLICTDLKQGNVGYFPIEKSERRDLVVVDLFLLSTKHKPNKENSNIVTASVSKCNDEQSRSCERKEGEEMVGR
jgi:hypothetical protein